ncbi:MAG: type II toxin-antitoxin system VapC family toxin [Chloroflexi bacterium]|nr:type II toxin-antitoxin system VapC family toxin [Chloroflexota bacterium]HEV8054391.1 type II toxin-antitoxin system VapC family toxin [Candidatus Limnocylindrales bacterium]
MRLLLDTHAWIWWLTNPERLSRPADAALRDADHERYLSPASTWELMVKSAAGRVSVVGSVEALVEEALAASGVQPLPIEHGHAVQLSRLPPHHRDPFDRMLVAQAQAEGLTLVTADRQLARYDVDTLW